MAAEWSRGCCHVSPGKRAKSRSVVIHVQPDSIARAANQASVTRLAFAFVVLQSRTKEDQCLGEERTTRQFGCCCIDSVNAIASPSAVGSLKILGCVVMRMTLVSTCSEIAKAVSAFTSSNNQARNMPCRSESRLKE